MPTEREYIEAAHAEAVRQGMTPDMISSLSYRGIAALAGADVDQDGNSPREFFYESVRRIVFERLSRQSDDDAREVLRQRVIDLLDSDPSTRGAWVERDELGRCTIDLSRRDPGRHGGR